MEYWVLPNPDCKAFDYAHTFIGKGILQCDFEVLEAFAQLSGLEGSLAGDFVLM
jgi:hypothetical protein